MRGLELGAVEYITLPFNPVELAPVIRKLLGRLARGEREELRREKLAEASAMEDVDEPGGDVGSRARTRKVRHRLDELAQYFIVALPALIVLYTVAYAAGLNAWWYVLLGLVLFSPVLVPSSSPM